MSVVRTDLDLDTIHLAHGAHHYAEGDTPDAGCVMEWVAYLAGEPWSDRPECVSPAITSFCIQWNDTLGDEDRDRLLKPFLTKVIGTRTTPEDEQVRGFMACDWLVRTFTPTWLRKAGLVDDAVKLEQLGALTTTELVEAALPVLQSARKSAAAAWAAAWAAAGDAAWAALADCVVELQASAVELLDRMCAVGRAPASR